MKERSIAVQNWADYLFKILLQADVGICAGWMDYSFAQEVKTADSRTAGYMFYVRNLKLLPFEVSENLQRRRLQVLADVYEQV